MAKDDIDLEDLDLDDFDLGYDDDFGGDQEPDRTPVRTAAKTIGKSVGDSLVSKQSLLRTSKQVLPDSYGKAVNLIEEAGDGISTIYNSAKDELGKSSGAFRGIAKQVDKVIGKRLPSILSDKLREFAEGDGDSYQWGGQNNAETITSELASIFGEQMDNAAREEEVTRQEQRLSTSMMVKQGQSLEMYANVTADGMSRLVSYQDNITSKFQRKSLELQYKQFFLQKELVERSAEYFGKQLAFSKGIEKNTSLPDAVKLQKSELLAHTIKERMISGTLNKVSDFTGKFTGGLQKNVGQWVEGVVGGISQGAEFHQMMEGLLESLPEEERKAFMLQQAGGFIGEKIRSIGADHAKPLVDRMMPERMKEGFSKLGGFTEDPSAWLAEYARKDTTRRGPLGAIEQFGKQFIPTFSRDSAIGSGNAFTDASEVAYFDNLTHRSITQIIPEYLSQIVRWTKATFTGTDDGDMGRDVYDFTTGRMASKSTTITNVKEQLFGQYTKYDRDDIDRFITELTGDAALTPDATSMLRRQLLEDMSKNVVFKPESWAKFDKYTVPGTPEATDELVGLFRARFNVDIDGNMAASNDDMRESIDSTRSSYVSLKNRIAIPTEHMKAIADTYGSEALERLGLVTSANGRSSINYDRIWDFILDENVGELDDNGRASAGGLIRPGQSGDSGHDLQAIMTQLTSALSERQSAKSQVNESGPGIGDDTMERYLGLHSPLLTVANAIDASTATSADHLQSIMTIMMSGNIQPGQISGISLGRVGNWLRDRAKSGIGMTKDYFKFFGRQYRKLGMMAKNHLPGAIKSTLSTGMSIGKKILGIKGEGEIGDIYVKGRLRAVLLARDIKAGLYKDRKTDKTITSIDDIHGEVIDVDGNVVLTADDYDAGLTDHQGKAIALKGWSLVKGYYGAVFGIYGKAFGIAGNLISKGIKALYEYKDKIDLYVKDNMSEPLLAYHKLRNGEYFDKDGKVYTKWSEIKDRVYDSQGRLVASMEDIRERGGFVDVSGKAVKGFLSGSLSTIKDLAKSGASMYGGYIKAIGKGIRGIGRGIGRVLGGGLGALGLGGGGGGNSEDFEYEMTFFAQEQTVLQENILEQLKILVAGGKNNPHDRDGDGIRDGSAADIRAKRAAAKESADKDGKGDSKTKGRTDRGLLGRTADKAKDFLSGKTAMALGAVGSAIGTATMATAGAIGSGLMAAGGMLWTGVTAVGGLIAGAVSLPVVAAVAAVAAVGYVGYKLWKRFSREDAKILEYRMAQYGVHYTEQDEVAKILSIEDLLEPYTTVDSATGKGKISPTDEVNRQFLEILGVSLDPSPDDDRDKQVARIAEWFTKRFQPAFIAHLMAKKEHAPSIPLHEIDAKITGRKALKYLEIAKCDDMVESGAYDMMTSPFEDGWVFNAKLSEDNGDVQSFYKTAVKYFTKKAKDEPEDDKEPEGEGIVPLGDSDDDDSDSKLIKAAKMAAMVSPAGLALTASKSLFDKVTNSSLFKGLTGFVGAVSGFITDVKDTIVSAIVPDSLRDGWNSLTESKPGLVELVRFMTYGLNEVDGAKVQILRRMELVVGRDLTTEGDWQGDPEKIYSEFSGRFKITGNGSSEGAVAWKGWFINRFLPVFTLTHSLAKQYVQSGIVDLDKTLNDAQRLEVATEIIKATFRYSNAIQEESVWAMEVSPWPGYTINTDVTTTSPVIAKLQDLVDGKGGGVLSGIGTFIGGLVDRVTGNTPDTTTSGDTSTSTPGNTSTSMAGIANTPHNPAAGQTFTADGTHRGSAGAMMGGVSLQGSTKGTGGKIDSIPMPNGAGWETSKDTIIAAAKAVGIDPALAATVAGQESTWDPNASASPASSAKGYFQFINKTWKYMLEKHGKKYGIPLGTSPLDPRANALMGAQYLKEGYDNVKKALKGQREPTDVDVYLNHFLGPGGVRKFLKAPPGASAAAVMGADSARANPSIFMEGRRARTVAEVYQHMDRLLAPRRSQHGLSPAGSGNELRPMESSANVGDGSNNPSWMTEGLEGGYSKTTETTIGYTDASGNRGSVTSSVTSATPNYPTGGSSGTTPSGGSTTLPTGAVGSMEQATAAVGGDVKKLVLQREASTDSGTYGKLTLPDGSSFITLELGWRNNKPRSSCIPAGTYVVKIKIGGKYKRAYRLEDVPGRSEILIHAGNTAGNTERGEKSDVLGCILLGTGKMKFGNQPGIVNSRVAMDQFMRTMAGQPFIMTILDGGVEQATLDKELPTTEVPAVSLTATAPTSSSDYGSSNSSGGSYDTSYTPQPTPVQSTAQATMVADVQSRSRDLPVMNQMAETENLLAIGNQIATSTLETMQSIHALVKELKDAKVPTDLSSPKAKESPVTKTTKVQQPAPASHISFNRKRIWGA